MAALTRAIRNFLHAHHDAPVSREAIGMHEGTPTSQNKNDPRLHMDVFELTLEMIALKQEIDSAELEQKKFRGILLPHRKRMQILVERYQALKIFFESQCQEENVKLVVSRIERMELGIQEIDGLLNAKTEAIDRLSSVHDSIVRTIMKRAQIRSFHMVDLVDLNEESLITEAMVLPDSLDTFENQAGEIEDDMKAEAADQRLYQCSESGYALPFTSEDEEDHERIDLMKRLGSLKWRRTELEERLPDHASLAGKIQALSREINELGDEIAIRGAPCVEGSIIFHDGCGNAVETTGQISEVQADQDMEDLAGSVINQSHKEIREYEGPGLFDGVTDIETPVNDPLSNSEMLETETEQRERVQRATKRAELWVSQLAVDAEQPLPDAEEMVLHIDPGHNEELKSIVVGESNSVYNTASSGFASVILRCRIDSWAKICERQYRELDPEAHAAHPRGVISE